MANLTLIGNGTSSLNGMRLRRGTGGHIVNAIVTGFKMGSAVRIDGNTSIGLVNSYDLKVEALYAYANNRKMTVAAAAGLADSAVTAAATLAKLDTWFLADNASLGVTSANPKPTSAGAGAIDSPTGFAAAKYLGAFDPAAATLWSAGWTKN